MKYIYQLIYWRKDWKEKEDYLFATEKAAEEFFDKCSEDNNLYAAVYLNKKYRGKDGMFHGHAARVLYRNPCC